MSLHMKGFIEVARRLCIRITALARSGGFKISLIGVANPWVWSENLLFGKIFPENCMKMKEIGPSDPVDPPKGSFTEQLL